jgi:putative FmdB family regulatory protein
MPLYEYECNACARRFEVIQKFSDPLVEICPTCGGVVHKMMSSPAIQFKGTGWYITDYAKKDGSAAGKGDESRDPGGSKDHAKEKEGPKEQSKTESEKSASAKDATPKAEAAPKSSPTSTESPAKAAKTND